MLVQSDMSLVSRSLDQRFVRGPGGPGADPGLLEQADQHLPHRGLVVDHQDRSRLGHSDPHLAGGVPWQRGASAFRTAARMGGV